MTDTFLAPIEQPDGLVKKLAYYFTRRQFGKVITPLKVHSARLPQRGFASEEQEPNETFENVR